MPDVYFRYILLAALAIALLYAAYTDIRSRLIENWLNAAIALAAPLYWWASGSSSADIAWQLGLGAITFALLAALFFMGWIGGGDVKLLAALALWFAPLAFFQLVFMASVVGGVMTTVGSVLNLAPAQGRCAGRLVVWSSAALSLAVMLYVGWVLTGGQPADLARITGSRGVLYALLGLILAFMSLGSIITARHQKQRLRIPYGVAISAGALWAMSAHVLPAVHQAAPTGLGG